MIIKNPNNYPPNIVRGFTPKPHTPDPNRIGVTALIGSPLERTLKLRHHDEIAMNIDDMISLFHGNIVDEIVKQSAGPWDLTQVKIEIPTPEGLTLVGKPDIISVKEGKLIDIKYVGAFSLVYDSSKEYWEKQLNVYDFMIRFELGKTVINHMEIHALLRDWTKYKAHEKDYPSSPIQIIPIHAWHEKAQEHFIEERLQDHINNPERECTPEEKWQEEDTYAVMKKGAKRASRVLNSRLEAEEWLNTKGTKGMEIVKRKGKCKKCEDYCSVRYFCPYSGLQEKNNG